MFSRMRLGTSWLTAPVGCVLLVFGLTSTAQAGFISTGVDLSQSDFALFGFSAGASAPSKDRDESPAPARQLKRDVGILPQFGSLGSGGGMSSTHSAGGTAGSGASQSALIAADVDVSVELAARLGPQGRVWLPPPFSTGVFRPPRCMG